MKQYTCPRCNKAVVPYDSSRHNGDGWSCGWYEGKPDLACEPCKYMFTTEEAIEHKKNLARIRANALRKARDSAMRSIGMIKVRGSLGGTYWE